MDTAMNLSPDPADVLGHRLRIAIRMLAGGRGISVGELGRRTGVGDQKMRDRLDDTRAKPPTRLSVEETAKIAREFEMTLTELVQIAEDGTGLPLPAQCERFELLDGGCQDGDQTTFPFQTLKSIS